MPDLFLVRHCEPEITGVLLGQSDPGLSEAGRKHAATLVQGVKLAVIHSSPLRRALETAQIFARGKPIQVMDDLREITYGAWDGRAWAEVEAADREFASRKLKDWNGLTPRGGEPWPRFVARVTRAFEQIRAGPRPAAIVSHAAVIHVIAHIDQPYGGVHEL